MITRTAGKCTECKNETEDEELALCVECEHAKDCTPSKKIEFGNAWFTGAFIAKCKKCNFVCAYWECGCELEHDCNEYKGEK